MGKTKLFYGEDSVLPSFDYFVRMIHFLWGPLIQCRKQKDIQQFRYWLSTKGFQASRLTSS